MSKVTYTTKVDAQITATADVSKVSASDMNMIKSSINTLYDERGWANYRDSEGSDITVTTSATTIAIDASGATSETSYLPTGLTNVTNFWNESTNRITPDVAGDAYDLRFDLDIISKTSNPTTLTFELDISASGDQSIVIVERFINVAKTPPYTISIAFPIFSLSTFVANGGLCTLKTDTGSLTIRGRGLFIKRDFSPTA